ncbi:MAG: nitrite/sulfite reductase [Gammaproteobacteria bacterium TMED1]|nr:MAG: nitrite/sulfite reductase [Gammaproteobacteria bacterium TMED1]|tara:strand:+ start:3899 stop:5551 length:1653 start_codon:yes stop_codon:yes gene_type:complete
MYTYDPHDQKLVDERVAQYREQTERFLAGKIPAEEFQQLRLRNGLYVQRLAPMLRIAVPYGMLSSKQLRKVAHITRYYDKGYGHLTTRQNIQLNWPHLEEVPDILEELASVQMHAIQTSGSCVRNVTTDQYAGSAKDEIEDPRPWAELLRQWSTFHPEFNWLPRKFKIAVSGSLEDRAAIQVHDIGLRIVERDGIRGFQILVGGGLGRTPVIGSQIKDFLDQKHLLTYTEAILRVYNRYGRRDNKYKARIKILVRAMTPEVFREKVEVEWASIKDGPGTLTVKEVNRAKSSFSPPKYDALTDIDPEQALISGDAAFKNWLKQNVLPHKMPGYAIVNLAVKATGIAPGDITDEQMELIADLADAYSFGELRVTHEQNITLADVKQKHLYALWQRLVSENLSSPNLGLLTDMICCPGGDFCSLANAKSIPVAEAIQRRFDQLDYLHDLGELHVNISGCMNACGHHHVGNIGILGVDKKGHEFYQISIGGSANFSAAIGKILGPSFAQEEIPAVIETIVQVYVTNRESEEQFLDTLHRIGIEPFKDAVYQTDD